MKSAQSIAQTQQLGNTSKHLVTRTKQHKLQLFAVQPITHKDQVDNCCFFFFLNKIKSQDNGNR